MSLLIIHRNPFEPFPYRDWLTGYPGDVVVLASRDRIEAAGERVPHDAPGLTHLEVVPDYHDEQLQLQQALMLAEKFQVTRVIAHHEADLLVAARVREQLGLVGAWTADVVPYRDKSVMKRVLTGAGVPVADHAVVSRADQVRAFAARHGFPVVVKDIAGYNAIGLQILDSPAHLDADLDLTGPALAESFVPGPMCHVDGLVVGGRTVLAWASQYQYSLASFGSDPGARVDLTLEPSDPLSVRLLDLVERSVRALRVSDRHLDHAFHAEVFHTPDDRLVVCEIAARTGGAKIREVGAAALGVNHGEYLTRAQLDLPMPLLAGPLAGGPPLAPTRMGGQVLMMKRPGHVAALPPAPTQDWVSRFWCYAEVGDVIPPAAGSADFLLAAVATAADPAQARTRLRGLGARFEEQTRILEEPS
ncbi:MAG: ATP-grasp domain-containing protein [Angustibacter sp.]